ARVARPAATAPAAATNAAARRPLCSLHIVSNYTTRVRDCSRFLSRTMTFQLTPPAATMYLLACSNRARDAHGTKNTDSRGGRGGGAPVRLSPPFTRAARCEKYTT